MLYEVITSLRARRAFASIDVHNNTGINPHYACINRIDNRHRVASLIAQGRNNFV